MRTLVLVLDIGTSSVRASWYRPDGSPAGAGVQTPYRWDAPEPGRMEVDLDRLLELCVETIDRALELRGELEGTIAAVACATFWHGIGAVDARGVPSRAVAGWADRVAGGESPPTSGGTAARTGCAARGWYPRERIAALPPTGKGHVWLSIGEYLYERLFGVRATSRSLASGTGLMDLARGEWDPAALECAGIEASALPAIRGTDEPLHGLREPWRSRWEALAGVPWLVPLGDGACANVGLGCTGTDRIGVTIGTSAAVRILWTGAPAIPPGATWCYLLDETRPVAGRSFSNAGNGVAFFRSMFDLPGGDDLDALLASVRPTAQLPRIRATLVPERDPTPGDDEGIRIDGLRPGSTPEEVVVAWMAAVAQNVGGAIERLDPGGDAAVRAGGGAVQQSGTWATLLASACGRPISVPADAESTSRGLALYAAEVLELGPPIDEAPYAAGSHAAPDPEWAEWLGSIQPKQRMR